MATFEEAQYDFIRNSPSGERHISEVGAFNSGFRAGASSRDAEVEEAQAQLERATDLVRYARHFLHEEELISDEEYAAIVQDNEDGKRVARLEGYNSLRSQVTRWKKAVEGLTAGGSEYVDNPEACAAAIRQRMNVPKIVLDLRSKIEALSGQYQIEQARADGLAEKIEATRALAERLIQGGGVFEVITAKQFLATLGKQGEGGGDDGSGAGHRSGSVSEGGRNVEAGALPVRGKS